MSLTLIALLAAAARCAGFSADPARALSAARAAAALDRLPVASAAPAQAEDFRFSTGNQFEAVALTGRVTVSCRDHSGQSDFASVRCSGEVLDPAEFARFVGPKGLDADAVSLTASWEGGGGRQKSDAWLPAEGRSRGRFNLWVSTLLQRPLLDYGRNELRFVLTKDGRTVREGRFEAGVRRGASRACRRGRHYQSSDMMDCRGGASRVCSRYFADENYCQ